MRKIIVAAISKNRVLGNDQELVWNLPRDKAFFHETIQGGWLLMGRKTHQSAAIEGHVNGTTEIVVTRQKDYFVEYGLAVSSLEEGERIADEAGQEKLYVLGGGQIYAQAMERADELILTEIDAEFEGDTFFPEVDPRMWEEVWRESYPADEENEFPLSFVRYVRRA